MALRQPANMAFPCDSEAALAVEGTSVRCAVTGLLTDPWWRVDLGTSYVVDVVDIRDLTQQDGRRERTAKLIV